MTPPPAKRAATDVVAHATLKDVGAHVGGRSTAGIASVQPVLRRKIHDEPARVRPVIHALNLTRIVAPELSQILPRFGCTSDNDFGEETSAIT
jgi:hypothetical protein